MWYNIGVYRDSIFGLNTSEYQKIKQRGENMVKKDTRGGVKQIHIRISEDDLQKLNDLVKYSDDPFNSQARVIRHLIRMEYKNLKDEMIADGRM